MSRVAAGDSNTDRALASLAVLNVNWHANARSYLDSFVPFAVEALRLDGRPDFSEDQASDAITATFALRIPTAVVGAILKRATKRGLATRLDGGAVSLTERAIELGAPLQAELATLLREQEDLEDSLVAFAMERFRLEWGKEAASKALLAYVEDASARMIVANYRAATPGDSYTSEEHERIVIAAFIESIWVSQPQRFEYLLNVAKGSFLATTLFFQNHFDQHRKFKNRLSISTRVL